MLLLRSPRRSHRPLLLPPGWVALGCLLLLGCLALRAHWRQLRPVNVLQIAIPPWRVDTTLLDAYQLPGQGREAADYNPYLDAGARDAQTRTNPGRPWQRFFLKNEASADLQGLVAIELNINAMRTDASQTRGLRIEFDDEVPYARLIALLDLLDRLKQYPHWLDSRHRYLTFYVAAPRRSTLVERRQSLAVSLAKGDRDADFTHIFPPQTLSQRLKQLSTSWRRPQVLLAGAVGALLLALLTVSMVAARLMIR